jgi:transposase
VWIDAEGHVGAQDVASIENEPSRIVYCCERGCHFVLAYRLYEWKKAVIVDPPAIAAKLEELADRGGVGLTPHQIAIDRALAAVAIVNDALEKAASAGELREMNVAFKEARKVDPSVRYVDYLEARKAAMLEALARS